ncbi:MAG: hypothetical protein N3B18_05880 [Desulfobacterota bacterium]|nr:hypothetical protein [Thermodesulfobacteriota bacterium]
MHAIRPAMMLGLVLFSVFGMIEGSFAAVGCDLNDPDRDVARLFPGATGYKTIYVSIERRGGPELLKNIEERLGDSFRGIYETIDVPYTIYEIMQGTERIGYIHGVNAKGQYGGIQVFLALDLNGVIQNFYFQKLTSRFGKELRSHNFGAQFIGLSLKDFYHYNVVTGMLDGNSTAARITNPVPEAEADFKATLRAVKKNLILMDEFVYGNRYLHYCMTCRAQERR